MKATDQVGITFASLVLTRGILHGVVNLTLGAYEFNPAEDKKVDPSPVITSRLRMDVPCAIALRDALDELIQATKPAEGGVVAHMNGSEPAAGEKPN